jgi:hypothetical protein
LGDDEEQEDYEEHSTKIINKLQEDDPKVQQEILKLIHGDSLGQKIVRETVSAKEAHISEVKARELVAISEDADTTSHRSKRRAASVDQHSGE